MKRALLAAVAFACVVSAVARAQKPAVKPQTVAGEKEAPENQGAAVADPFGGVAQANDNPFGDFSRSSRRGLVARNNAAKRRAVPAWSAPTPYYPQPVYYPRPWAQPGPFYETVSQYGNQTYINGFGPYGPFGETVSRYGNQTYINGYGTPPGPFWTW